MRELIRIAELAEPERDETLVGVKAEEFRRDGPPRRWILFFEASGNLLIRSRSFVLEEGKLTEKAGPGSYLPVTSLPAAELAALPTLAAVLRGAEVPEGTDLRSVGLSRGTDGPVWELQGPWPARYRIDAATGEVLSPK